MAKGRIPALPFDDFLSYDEVKSFLESLAAARPHLARLTSLGPSREGREVLCLTVTDFERGAPEDKPGFLIHGNIHASELSGAHASLFTARQLLADHSKKPNLLEILYPHLNVFENIAFPLKIGHQKAPEIKKAVEQTAAILEISDLLTAKPAELSGGQRQRVAIARAFVLDPPLILADEPTGNLDHHNSEKIHTLLLDSVKKRNKSLVIVTHDHNLASLCNKKYLLKEGKLERLH